MALDQLLVDEALKGLTKVRDTTPAGGWERTVVDAGLSALARDGLGAVQGLEQSLADLAGGKLSLAKLTQQVGHTLSLREASDLMGVLENGEASRVQRSRELLQTILSVATTVAGELLKLALGGRT